MQSVFARADEKEHVLHPVGEVIHQFGACIDQKRLAVGRTETLMVIMWIQNELAGIDFCQVL